MRSENLNLMLKVLQNVFPCKIEFKTKVFTKISSSDCDFNILHFHKKAKENMPLPWQYGHMAKIWPDINIANWLSGYMAILPLLLLI